MRTWTAPPDPEPAIAAAPLPALLPDQPDTHTAGGLRWGYTIASLDTLTRSALSNGWGARMPGRYDIVWGAIAVSLYAATQPPKPGQLVAAGRNAISIHHHDNHRHWGIRPDGSSRPRYDLYWNEIAAWVASPENGVLERIALAQIWPQLTAGQQQALTALAVHGEYQTAADALGLDYHTFYARIRKGRARFLALWHEGETPSGLWGHDRRGRHIQRSGNDNVMGVVRRRHKATAGSS